MQSLKTFILFSYLLGQALGMELALGVKMLKLRKV